MSIIELDASVARAADEFPALARFFGAYFHEDWHEDFATTRDAVNAFLQDAPPATVAAVRGELDRLLGLDLEDGLLGRVLRQGLDCNYVPSVDELSNGAWLAQVRDVVRASAG